jgi:hypothetical protein
MEAIMNRGLANEVTQPCARGRPTGHRQPPSCRSVRVQSDVFFAPVLTQRQRATIQRTDKLCILCLPRIRTIRYKCVGQTGNISRTDLCSGQTPRRVSSYSSARSTLSSETARCSGHLYTLAYTLKSLALRLQRPLIWFRIRILLLASVTDSCTGSDLLG